MDECVWLASTREYMVRTVQPVGLCIGRLCSGREDKCQGIEETTGG